MIYNLEILLESLEENVQSLSSIINDELKKVRFRLRYCAAGRLRISKQGKNYQYYLLDEEHSKGKYLSKIKDAQLIENLARKKYYTLLSRILTKELKALNSFRESADFSFARKICQKVEKGYHSYVQDIHLDRKQFMRNWQQMEPISQNSGFHEENLLQTTSFGLKVRSKSEVLIAEALYRHNIPFRYEAPVYLEKENIISIHPDFTCLNPKTCREVIWEHFGKMDDPEYAERAVAKLNLYEEKGFRLGENLCITMETSGHQLTVAQIERHIQNCIIPRRILTGA